MKTELAKASGDREKALLGGLGSCRREAATRVLADRLDAKPDAEMAIMLVKALGTSGNAAAWKVLGGADQSAARALAAKSLVRAYVAYDGRVREAAANAILVVDDASTPTLLSDAKKNGADVTTIERRLAHNAAR